MSDQKVKAAVGKPPLNLLPLSALVGVARVFGYGAQKYEPGNFLTATDDGIGDRYVGACLRHLASMQRPDGLYDLMSLDARDRESGLPDIDHAICGLMMLRALLTARGALPLDPGIGHDPPDLRPADIHTPHIYEPGDPRRCRPFERATGPGDPPVRR